MDECSRQGAQVAHATIGTIVRRSRGLVCEFENGVAAEHHNHALFGVNKRTALASPIVFRDRNGLVLTISHEEFFRRTPSLAQHVLVPLV